MPITPSCEVDWTDPSITTNAKIRTVHIQELRYVLNRERSDRQMQTVSFTDSALDTTTKIRTVHIEELRQAIEQTPKSTTCDAYRSSVCPQENTSDETLKHQGVDTQDHVQHRANHNHPYHTGKDYCNNYYTGDDSNHHYSYLSSRESGELADNHHYEYYHRHHAVNPNHRGYVNSSHDAEAKMSKHTGQRTTQYNGALSSVRGTYFVEVNHYVLVNRTGFSGNWCVAYVSPVNNPDVYSCFTLTLVKDVIGTMVEEEPYWWNESSSSDASQGHVIDSSKPTDKVICQAYFSIVNAGVDSSKHTANRNDVFSHVAPEPCSNDTFSLPNAGYCFWKMLTNFNSLLTTVYYGDHLGRESADNIYHDNTYHYREGEHCPTYRTNVRSYVFNFADSSRKGDLRSGVYDDDAI